MRHSRDWAIAFTAISASSLLWHHQPSKCCFSGPIDMVGSKVPSEMTAATLVSNFCSVGLHCCA